MAYENEFASSEVTQDLINGDLLEIYKSINISYKRKDVKRFDKNVNNKMYTTDDVLKIKHMFVIDGSKYESPDFIDSNAKFSILNINQCCIDVEKWLNFTSAKSFTNDEYKKIKDDIQMMFLLPVSGAYNDKYKDEKDFFRFVIYEVFKKNQNKIINYFEKIGYHIKIRPTLLETYKDLINSLEKDVDLPHPCQSCKDAGKVLETNMFKESDILSCECGRDLYVTDLLGFSEQLNNHISDEHLTTQIMLVMEKIITFNAIQILIENKHMDLIKESIFIMDGTLALYSYASWLSNGINKKIEEYKEISDLLLISIEKTGAFNEHLIKMERYFRESKEPLKNGMYYFLDDSYIRSNIKFNSTGNKVYGEDTYFGKKMYYINGFGGRYVVNVAYENTSDKFEQFENRNLKSSIKDVKRLSDIFMILECFYSEKYKDALSVVAMANQGASIPSSGINANIINDFLYEVKNKL